MRANFSRLLPTLALVVGSLVIPLNSWAQDQPLERINRVGGFSGAGIVEDIQPGEIIIRKGTAKQAAFMIQDKDDRFISLDGNDYIVNMPARIRVAGKLPGKLIEKGMVVQFTGEINRSGRTGKPVKDIKVLSGKSELKLFTATEPSGKAMVPCEFVGIVQRFSNQKIYLVVPKTKLSPTERVTVQIAEDAFFDIESDDLNRVRAGDKVLSFAGDKMANGAMVIRKIEVELAAEREVATTSFSEQLFLKYSKLSNEPGEAREETSAHFILYTDISPRSSKVLLEKLETMYGFLARYYRKKPKEPIECYVVTDRSKFRGIPPIGAKKIDEGSGVTSSKGFAIMKGNRVKGRRTRSVVYSCDDHKVVQHEAVHAYCSMAFGTAGPVWYAEGMAEMGQYWTPNELGVHIEPVVIEYLTNAEKKKLFDIVAAGQITGDSWKAYAWRWALCHLLANNPNYSKRFHDLGVNLMAGKKDSFRKAFGKNSEQIAFEYDQFIANFDNGYRVDLCVWEWREDPQELGDRQAGVTVNAQQGWQATGVMLDKELSYDFICTGAKDESGNRVSPRWTIKKDSFVSPDGNSRGDGKLVGAILTDYELSEPFEIGGKNKAVKIPASGQLYLRCQEKWNALADNDGQVKVYVRRSQKK